MTEITHWLKNYVALDAGNLWVHPAWAPVLIQNGWTSAAGLLQETFEGELLRRRDITGGWDNVRWAPSSVPGSPMLYVKRHRRSTAATSPAIQEAHGVSRCQQAGAPCMDMIAVGNIPMGTADSAGREFFSFFISDSIGLGKTAQQAMQQALAAENSDVRVRQIIEAVAFTVARFHSANLFHGDCHFVHFLMDGEGEAPQARVIDLQGMCATEGMNAYYLWLKDMGQLRHSLIRLGAYHRYADVWYAAYCSSIESKKIQGWINSSGRWHISLRGDWRLLRRIVSSMIKLDFSRAGELLQDRMRAA